MAAVLKEDGDQPSEFFRAALARLVSAPVYYTREQMAKIDAPTELQLVSGDPKGVFHRCEAVVAEDTE